MSKITDALAIASAVHAGQVDKAGAPYMRHILMVWGDAKRKQLTEEEQVVAILHDTIEDDTTNTITPSFLASLFGWTVANAVNDLTRCEGEEYLGSYINRVKNNPIALSVKLLDLTDHLNRIAGDEANLLTDRNKATMRKRYTKAMEILTHN